MKLKLLTAFATMALFVYSCGEKPASENINPMNEEMVDMHTSENALDWDGTYEAVLPCADCEGILTRLNLSAEGTYTLETKYLGVEEETEDKVEGTFEWREGGNSIKLDGIEEGSRSPYFKVEENRVRYLDMEGNEVDGAMADLYILEKIGNRTVEDIKWELIELNGQPIEGSADTHYILFDSNEGRLQAKANCNVINLPYTIKNQLLLEIGEGAMTMMACPDDTEDQLLKVLGTVDNLSTDGETLSLNKAKMAPLAKFKLVE